MKTVTLEAWKDYSTGKLGLTLLDMPRNDTTNAGDGLQIAHDLIEHVNGPEHIGTIHDELEALGAIWYVRGQHGNLRPNDHYSPAENISSDIARMFADWCNGADLVFDCKRTRAGIGDDDIQDSLRYADGRFLEDFDQGAERTKARIAWPKYRAEALARMRVGYRKARARYERHGRYAANSLFSTIVDALKHVKPDYEGQRWTLRYGNGEATCSEVYDDEY